MRKSGEIVVSQTHGRSVIRGETFSKLLRVKNSWDLMISIEYHMIACFIRSLQ